MPWTVGPTSPFILDTGWIGRFPGVIVTGGRRGYDRLADGGYVMEPARASHWLRRSEAQV